MKSSTQRILSIFLSGALFIATLVVYANFIRPAVAEVSEKRSVLYSKVTTFEGQRDAVARVQELVTRLKGAAKLEQTVSLLLPNKPGVTEALSQIRAITDASGVGLQSFSITPKSFESSRTSLVRRLGILEIGLSVEGGYENVKRFVQALETNVRIFNVQDFRMGPTRGTKPGEGEFLAQVTVEVYYQE